MYSLFRCTNLEPSVFGYCALFETLSWEDPPTSNCMNQNIEEYVKKHDGLECSQFYNLGVRRTRLERQL